MRTNIYSNTVVHTQEGAPAVKGTPFMQLLRTVMSCMLWEGTAYESGGEIAERIEELCQKCTRHEILMVACRAHKEYHLRHVPLFLIVCALKYKRGEFETGQSIANAIEIVCTRPDQMTELLSLYWKQNLKFVKMNPVSCPLAKQLKLGLARAFGNFDEYQLAKYNRDGPVKLRDVLFLCHAKPKDEAQEKLWRRLIDGELKTPDTWEVRLSSGADKQQSFEQLLMSHKMGKLAILRNLRNMSQAGVSAELVKLELLRNSKPMLPFAYLAAAAACPEWEATVDAAMQASMQNMAKLPGKTLVMVDVSGSMDAKLSDKSMLTRMTAACGLALLLREVCEEVFVYSFSNEAKAIPPRQGMALRDAIVGSQPHGGTYLGKALFDTLTSHRFITNPINRLIVITDEQIGDKLPTIINCSKYMLNIAPHQYGVAEGDWVTINGFSEQSVRYIGMIEGYTSFEATTEGENDAL